MECLICLNHINAMDVSNNTRSNDALVNDVSSRKYIENNILKCCKKNVHEKCLKRWLDTSTEKCCPHCRTILINNVEENNVEDPDFEYILQLSTIIY